MEKQGDKIWSTKIVVDSPPGQVGRLPGLHAILLWGVTMPTEPTNEVNAKLLPCPQNWHILYPGRHRSRDRTRASLSPPPSTRPIPLLRATLLPSDVADDEAPEWLRVRPSWAWAVVPAAWVNLLLLRGREAAESSDSSVEMWTEDGDGGRVEEDGATSRCTTPPFSTPEPQQDSMACSI
uniref:Uncharacterized protein n=1 Tax=Oryza punctata TaxID=4537 RepID=A0A0E0JEF5_ORYPU